MGKYDALLSQARALSAPPAPDAPEPPDSATPEYRNVSELLAAAKALRGQDAPPSRDKLAALPVTPSFSKLGNVVKGVIPTSKPLPFERTILQDEADTQDYLNNKENSALGRGITQAITGARDTAESVGTKISAGLRQSDISAIARAESLPDDFVEPAQPAVGSMGGYSPAVKGRTKQQILDQAYADAGITPEQLPALRQMNVDAISRAGTVDKLKGAREQQQQDIDALQGRGLTSRMRQVGASGLESALLMAPAIPLSTGAQILGKGAQAVAGLAGALVPASLSTMTDSESAANKAGLSGSEAARYIATDVALETLPAIAFPSGAERIMAEPTKKALQLGLRQGLKTLGLDTVKEIPEELLTTIGQQINAYYSDVDPNALDFDNLSRSVAETVASTGSTMGIIGTPGVISSAKDSLSGRADRFNSAVSSMRESGMTDIEIEKAIYGEDKLKAKPTLLDTLDPIAANDRIDLITGERIVGSGAKAELDKQAELTRQSMLPNLERAKQDAIREEARLRGLAEMGYDVNQELGNAILAQTTAPPQEGVPTAQPGFQDLDVTLRDSNVSWAQDTAGANWPDYLRKANGDPRQAAWLVRVDAEPQDTDIADKLKSTLAQEQAQQEEMDRPYLTGAFAPPVEEDAPSPNEAQLDTLRKQDAQAALDEDPTQTRPTEAPRPYTRITENVKALTEAKKQQRPSLAESMVSPEEWNQAVQEAQGDNPKVTASIKQAAAESILGRMRALQAQMDAEGEVPDIIAPNRYPKVEDPELESPLGQLKPDKPLNQFPDVGKMDETAAKTGVTTDGGQEVQDVRQGEMPVSQADAQGRQVLEPEKPQYKPIRREPQSEPEPTNIVPFEAPKGVKPRGMSKFPAQAVGESQLRTMPTGRYKPVIQEKPSTQPAKYDDEPYESLQEVLDDTYNRAFDGERLPFRQDIEEKFRHLSDKEWDKIEEAYGNGNTELQKFEESDNPQSSSPAPGISPIPQVTPKPSDVSLPQEQGAGGDLTKEVGYGVIWDKDSNTFFYGKGNDAGNARDKARSYINKAQSEGQTVFYRATDNPNEHKIGDFNSKNKAQNFQENGLSVSQHPYYKDSMGYQYIGVVSGDIVGYGSDGEPLLKNIKWLHKPIKDTTKLPAKYQYENVKKQAPYSYKDVDNAKFVYVGRRDDIVELLDSGVKVPPEVLADYPDLAEKYGNGEKAAPVEKKPVMKAKKEAAPETTAKAKEKKPVIKADVAEKDIPLKEAKRVYAEKFDKGDIIYDNKGKQYRVIADSKYDIDKRAYITQAKNIETDKTKVFTGAETDITITRAVMKSQPRAVSEKEQNQVMLSDLDKAWDRVKNEKEKPKDPPLLVIEVPDGGVFRVFETKDNIEALRKKVKNIGTGTGKYKPPTRSFSGKESNPPKLGTITDPLKSLDDFRLEKRTNQSERYLETHQESDMAYAMDGPQAAIIKGNFTPKGGIEAVKALLKGKRQDLATIDTGELWKMARLAKSIGDSMALVENTDGSIGVFAFDELKGESAEIYSIVKKGGKIVGYYDVDRVIKSLKHLRGLGNEQAKIQIGKGINDAPILFLEADNSTHVIMPLNEEKGGYREKRGDIVRFSTATLPIGKARTQSFNEWFGDSKAVDENGEPLTLYHGTWKGGFTEFETKRFGEGIFFTDNRDMANTYSETPEDIDIEKPWVQQLKGTKPGVYSVNLSMQNPLEIDWEGKNWINNKQYGSTNKAVKYAFENGYDGVIFRNVQDEGNAKPTGMTGDLYVVFDSTQIKHATKNEGTYDKTNPNILKSTASTSRQASTVESVKATAQALKSNWNNAPKNLVILQSVPELEADYGIEGATSGTRGAYDPRNDTVYLIADNLANAQETQFVMMHEVVGHRGIESILGDKSDTFFQGLYDTRLKDMTDYRKANGISVPINKAAQRELAREWLADRSGDITAKSDPTLWAKIKDALRRFLDTITGKKFTDAQLDSLITAGLKHAKNPPKGVTFDNRLEPARFAGYAQDFSKSNNAIDAEKQGRFPASRIAKEVGVPVAFIREHAPHTGEYHHTGKFYNTTNYYDLETVQDWMEGKGDYAPEEGETGDKTGKELFAEWKEKDKTLRKGNADIVRGANIKYLEWGGTRQHPKATERTEDNVTITRKPGQKMVTITRENGTSFKKGLDTNGFEILNHGGRSDSWSNKAANAFERMVSAQKAEESTQEGTKFSTRPVYSTAKSKYEAAERNMTEDEKGRIDNVLETINSIYGISKEFTPKNIKETLSIYRKPASNENTYGENYGRIRTLLQTISWYSKKHPTINKIYQAAQNNVDNAHVFDDMITHDEDGTNAFTFLTKLAKQDKKSFEKLGKYLFQHDRDQNGYIVRKQKNGDYVLFDKNGKTPLETFSGENAHEQAWDAAYKRESEEYRGTQEAKDALYAVRRMNRRAFLMLSNELEVYMNWADNSGQSTQVKLPEKDENGKQITVDLHDIMREMHDRSGYYMPRNRKRGNYHVIRQRGEKGTDSFERYRETYATKALAAAAIVHYRKQGWKVEDIQEDKTPSDDATLYARLNAINELVGNALSKMSEDVDKGIKTTDSLQQDVVNAIGGELVLHIANSIRARGSRSHMIGRSDDVGNEVWLGYDENPITALATYYKSTAAGTAKRELAKKFMLIFNGQEETWNEFVERKLSRAEIEAMEPEQRKELWEEYSAQVEERRIHSTGQQAHMYKNTQEYIFDMLRNDSPSERFMGMVKGISSIFALSGVAPGALNASALAITVPAALKLHGIPIRKSIPLISKGVSGYTSHALEKNRAEQDSRGFIKGYKSLFGYKGRKLNSDEQQIFDYISKMGWDTPMMNEELTNAMRGEIGIRTQNVVDWLMIGMSTTERINRAATIYAAYNGLRSKIDGDISQKKFEELMHEARTISNEAHGDYGKKNLPSWARGDSIGSQVLRAGYTFKTFFHNQLQLANALIQGGEYGALAYIIASTAAIGGTLGIPFEKAISSAIGWILQSMFPEAPDDPIEALAQKIDEVSQPLGNFARYGIAGVGGYGINMASSMNPGEGLIPETVFDLLGPLYSIPAGIALGVGNLATGNQRGLEQSAPRAISGVFKGYREWADGVSTESGQPVFYGNERLKADTWQMALRAMGFNPVGISEKRNRQWDEKLAETKYSEQRTALYNRVRAFTDKGGTAGEWMEILADIKDFNEIVQNRGVKTALITRETLKGVMNGVLKAPKQEREREEGFEYSDVGDINTPEAIMEDRRGSGSSPYKSIYKSPYKDIYKSPYKSVYGR